MKKHIFYHIFPRFNWCEIFQEQLLKVIESGLYEEIETFTILLLSNDIRNAEWLRERTKAFSKITIVVEENEHLVERPTLRLIHDFAQSREENELILYMHMKGISYYLNEAFSISGSPKRNQVAWRRYLEHFTIHKWRDAEYVLSSGYWDTYGVNLRKDTKYGQYPHYNGNFWWATTNYLSGLSKEFYLERLQREDDRAYAEFWIGSGKGGRFYCAKESNINHYSFPYTIDYYAHEPHFNSPGRIEYKAEEKWEGTLLNLPSGWAGLERIMPSLIKDFSINPNRAVEFGVEWGYSTAVFSQCFKEVIGVDTFTGDQHSGFKEDHMQFTKDALSNYQNITLIKSDWESWATTIIGRETFDLIHVDIVHDYHNTFAAGEWAVGHSDVVIFHDVVSFEEVNKAVEDLAHKYKLFYYYYPAYNGLGILTRRPL